MRIRQVKPSFWTDSILARLPERTRLFYIGLWMVADDAGWFRADPPEIGNDLYGYESARVRERRVQVMLGELVDSRRIVLHPCGHGQVPRLTSHQHLAGLTKQVKTVENEHLLQCVSRPSGGKPAETRDSPQTPALVRLGKVSKGSVNEGIAREPSLKEKTGWGA